MGDSGTIERAAGSREGPSAGTRERASAGARRALRSAEILAVGSELTTGETHDTNAAELGAALTERGVSVRRLVMLPDDLQTVTDAVLDALARSDLVVATGGLGPTPDDLTREAIAAAIGEEPRVDAELERWVRGLWARRGLAFPESNLKQAWLVPSASPIPNEHGTAPGWWVDGLDGRVIVALPGPPREMRPMWRDAVVPRLVARGLGRPSVVRTLRLAGIGESQAADRIGRELLSASNPSVATYARQDAVDVRMAAFGESARDAEALASATLDRLREAIGDHVWGEGSQTWGDVLDEALRSAGLPLEARERGTRGALTALLGGMSTLRRAELVAENDRDRDSSPAPEAIAARPDDGTVRLELRASDAPSGRDLVVEITIDGPGLAVRERTTAFLNDEQGRARAAAGAAWALLRAIRERDTSAARETGPAGTRRDPR